MIYKKLRFAMLFKNVLYILFIAIGIAGVLDTLVLAVYTNVNLGTVLPGLAGGVLIVYSFIKLARKGRPIMLNSLVRRLVCIMLVAAIISFVWIEALIMLNSSSQDDVATEYLIILGAGVNGDVVSLALQERLLKGIEYLDRYPEASVILSGGQGPGENLPEAEAMERYLKARGISSNRILKEDRSTSTLENFIFSKELLNNAGKGNIARIMIITSDFHMFRSKMLARRAGFQPYGISCDTPVSVRINSYAREYFALIKSYFFDR